MHFTSRNTNFLTQGGAALDPCQGLKLPLGHVRGLIGGPGHHSWILALAFDVSPSNQFLKVGSPGHHHHKFAQGWIKCGSREHRSQEMTRKIEEIVTLGFEEKEKREKEERKEEEKKKRRQKEEVEIEEFSEEKEEHGDDKLI